MSSSSIRPIDWSLSDDTTPGLSGPKSHGNEAILYILQISSTTGALTLDSLISYPEDKMRGGTYLSTEMQLVYSTTPTNWAVR